MSEYACVLVIDSAMNGCAVGAYDFRKGSLASKAEVMARGQAERLMPMVEEVLAGAGLAYKDLQAIVTTIGPGSFTGVRVGVSAAKGLALALGVPIFGVSNLQALAFQCAQTRKPGKDIVALIETKRSDFYTQRFDANGHAIGAPQAEEAMDIVKDLKAGACVLVGDAVPRFLKEAQLQDDAWDVDVFDLIDPGFLAQSFSEEVLHRDQCTQDVHPLYLRAPDVTVPSA